MLKMYKMISQATLVTPGLCLASKWLPSLLFSPGNFQQDYNEDVGGCQESGLGDEHFSQGRYFGQPSSLGA